MVTITERPLEDGGRCLNPDNAAGQFQDLSAGRHPGRPVNGEDLDGRAVARPAPPAAAELQALLAVLYGLGYGASTCSRPRRARMAAAGSAGSAASCGAAREVSVRASPRRTKAVPASVRVTAFVFPGSAEPLVG